MEKRGHVKVQHDDDGRAEPTDEELSLQRQVRRKLSTAFSAFLPSSSHDLSFLSSCLKAKTDDSFDELGKTFLKPLSFFSAHYFDRLLFVRSPFIFVLTEAESEFLLRHTLGGREMTSRKTKLT